MDFEPTDDFGFEDFARLPVLERDDVNRAGSGLVSQAVPSDQLTKDATGGSTGAPTVVWVGPEERGWAESGIEYFLSRAGVRRGSSIGFLWGHHLDPVARDGFRARSRDFVHNVRWFDCFRLSTERLEEYHRELDRWRPACVIAYASALAALAEHVLERGHRASYPRRCFITGGKAPAGSAATDRACIRQAGSRTVWEP